MKPTIRNRFASHVDRVTTVPVNEMLHPPRTCWGCREHAYSGRHAKACPMRGQRRI
jgi:hypothetical protein